MKTITVQLLLRFASLRQTGNDLREDPNTWLRVIESELRPLNIGTVTRGRRQPLENTGVRLWTGLRSRRVGLCHAEMPRRESGGCVAHNRRRLRSHRQNRELIVVYFDDVMVVEQ